MIRDTDPAVIRQRAAVADAADLRRLLAGVSAGLAVLMLLVPAWRTALSIAVVAVFALWCWALMAWREQRRSLRLLERWYPAGDDHGHPAGRFVAAPSGRCPTCRRPSDDHVDGLCPELTE